MPQPARTSSSPSSPPSRLANTAKQRSSRGTGGKMTSNNPSQQGLSEDEPLLGRAGDASQQSGRPLYQNLFLGTAGIAQAGIWILTGIIWGQLLGQPVQLFTAHPLLNSAGLLLTTEAILLLQPTHTAAQKRSGAVWHSVVNGAGFAALIAGLIVIVYNKLSHNGTHFQSPHAILGLTTYCVFLVQAIAGSLAFYAPGLFGGVDQAKKLYKFHRMGGYLVLLMSLVTVCLATQTPWNANMGHIKLWTIVVAAVILLIGIVPRIRKHKLGL